jgi:hypothetical protein
MKQPQEIRVVFHGPEHAQYFQGHGVSFTRFTACVTGVGDSVNEALGDAREQLVNGCDWEVSEAQLREAVLAESGRTLEDLEADESDDREALHADCLTDHDECELHYYVSIDVR